MAKEQHRSIAVDSRNALFPTGPPDGLFFSTPALEQRLELLHHLVQFSDLRLVIRAPAGGGKTTLAKELLRRHGGAWHVVWIDVAPDLDRGCVKT